MASPFSIVAINPPAKRVGKSKGKRMARRSRRRRRIRVGSRRVRRAAGRSGKKFLGLSMPIVETGVGSAAGILGTNYLTGVALQKLAANKPDTHWSRQWYAMVGIKVAAAVGISIVMRKAKLGRYSSAVLAGGLSSAALSLARRFAPPQMFETRFGLAGDDAPDLAGNNISAALAGIADSSEVWDEAPSLNGFSDSAGIYSQLLN